MKGLVTVFRQLPWSDNGAHIPGSYVVSGRSLCSASFHRVFPKIRIRSGSRKRIEALLLGIPVDGLTDEQRQILRDRADHLEEFADAMRGENGAV